MDSSQIYHEITCEYGNILTISEIAKIMKVHEQTVYRWRRCGKLNIPNVHTADNFLLRFRSSDVADYLSLSDAVAAPAPAPAAPLKRGRPRKVATEA